MKTIGQMKMLLPLLILLGSLWLLALPPQGTLAQGGPLPTPTNIGGGGGGGGGGNGNGGGDSDDDDRSTPKPPGARVSGYVYNYSSGGYAGGIAVVLKGGGWQVETVTDSNGFYQIGDLGFGQAVLNLRLPPDAHQLGPDWPVLLASGADLRVDLGFYWGDAPTFPVALTSNLMNDMLYVQIENHTPDTVTGGLLEIELPAMLVASPAIEASMGSVDYGEHRVHVTIDDLPSGAKVTVQVPVQGQTVPQYAQADSGVKVLFTYDQQATPQIVQLDSQALASAPASSSSPAATATPSGATSAFTPPTPAVSSAEIKPLPVTGRPLSPIGTIHMIWPILVGLGLAGAGWHSLRRKTRQT